MTFHQTVGALAGDTEHGRGARHIAARGAQGGQQGGKLASLDPIWDRVRTDGVGPILARATIDWALWNGEE